MVAQIPIFIDEIMGRFAEVIGALGNSVLYRNTWGDGLYLVLSDVAAAARCALALQETMSQIDLPALQLPESLGLRIGGHVGPIFDTRDPILDRPSFYGSHVTHTARIEPNTPEGDVYVTEPFAALLALERDCPYSCEYVGHMPAVKDYGSFRMFVLKARRKMA